ncbi:hypothetical protein SAMD00019534_088630 [Acytostelium subglobosum LB1]|uniref:hypothetical protein n=1 Tax=Acytostelium subglobosum LB1 TaxID=1410327 RepID=UPI000644D366|nr:hypothetical protein SAMD00019534_088630 [Acytostelium subglobosum LB1]GAM25688.1 hypothetical protein SAMD00019534_088630 [Acytostelium subglobosum LB1]|eukprot:XP_012751206.1 hypothetical protein SAMD00019534_088630 [Acytostelium subglobosum LB1]
MSKPKICTKCQGTQFDTSNDGSTVCIQCGFVVDSTNIVTEIQFSETSGVMGTYVSKSSKKYHSLGSDSRELTLENARRRLFQVAGQVNLKPHHVDMGLRMYQMAIEHNFTRGRRSLQVAATVLYVVCRREQTPHLLIDFSEAIQINVFTLASTFIAFAKLFNIQLPIVDPSLFIHRFATSLEFGDKTQDVANTALKFVARMKRDWMATGRRPSGICGASLFLASKVHGFVRTIEEIIKVVKIGESTLTKRLDEFIRTPASDMKIAEFDSIEMDTECDPPAFTRNRQLEMEKEREKRKKEKIAKQKRRENGEDVSDDDDDDDDDDIDDGAKEKIKKTKDNEDKGEDDDGLEDSQTGGSKKRKAKPDDQEGDADDEQALKKPKTDTQTEIETSENIAEEIESILKNESNMLDNGTQSNLDSFPSTLSSTSTVFGSSSSGRRKTFEDFDAPLLPLDTQIDEYPYIEPEVDPEVFAPTATLSDLSDDDIESYIEHDQDARNVKETIWTELNIDWIRKQEERSKEIADAQAAGVPLRRKRAKKAVHLTPEEAVASIAAEQKRKDRIRNLVKNLLNAGDDVKEEPSGSPTRPSMAPPMQRQSTTTQSAAAGAQHRHPYTEQYEEEDRYASQSLLRQQYGSHDDSYYDDD